MLVVILLKVLFATGCILLSWFGAIMFITASIFNIFPKFWAWYHFVLFYGVLTILVVIFPALFFTPLYW